jgi:hypothetical protein
VGATIVATELLSAVERPDGYGTFELTAGIAIAVVAFPAWAIAWRSIRRALADPRERTSATRARSTSR